MPPIRVLIADDHALLREGLRRILTMEPDIEVVGESKDAEEVVERALDLEPDVILMDVNMPKGGGIKATRVLRDRNPKSKIIILTIHEESMLELVRAGASGYLLKDAEPTRVLEAIRDVNSGGAFIPSDLMPKVLGEFRRLSNGEGEDEAAASLETRTVVGGGLGHQALPHRNLETPLTEREREVLELIVAGRSNKEIAETLYISEKTVKNHITNILRKLDLHDRTQAAVFALKHGLVQPR